MSAADEAALAADIRAVDGAHSLGAGALAEALVGRGWRRSKPVALTDAMVEAAARAIKPDEDRFNRDLLAQAYDPDAFRGHVIEAGNLVAAIQFAARRHLALEAADRLLASDVFARIVRDEQREQRERDAKIAESYALSSDEARHLIRDVAFQVSYTSGYDRAASDIAAEIRKNSNRA